MQLGGRYWMAKRKAPAESLIVVNDVPAMLTVWFGAARPERTNEPLRMLD